MSLYDAAKDAVKLAQKADNAELVQKLLDVQKQALDMQEKQHGLNNKINTLEEELRSLKEIKKLKFEQGHDWLIDSDEPDIKLCPVCANRDGFKNPLDMDTYRNGWGGVCRTCKSSRVYE